MSTFAKLVEEHVFTADFSGWNALIQIKQRSSRLLKPMSTLSAPANHEEGHSRLHQSMPHFPSTSQLDPHILQTSKV